MPVEQPLQEDIFECEAPTNHLDISPGNDSIGISNGAGWHDSLDTSKIREFLRMNPRESTRSIFDEDLDSLVDDLQKVFMLCMLLMLSVWS